MNSDSLVIGDADALIALAYSTDTHHQQALICLNALEKKGATIIFPATAFAEAITAAQRKLDNPTVAQKIIELFNHGKIIIVPVDDQIISYAVTYFNIAGSKHNTFFDAIICAAGERYSTQTIYSFDKWYQKQGFTLATMEQ